MLYVPRFRAALLALLVFATSLSASVCDLSCSFPSAFSQCCVARLDIPGAARMAMSPDKTMSGMKMSGASGYGNNMARESDANLQMQHPVSLPPCASETCRQAWDSSSTRTPDIHLQVAANIQVSIHGNSPIGLRLSQKEITVSQSLALAPCISPLRI